MNKNKGRKGKWVTPICQPHPTSKDMGGNPQITVKRESGEAGIASLVCFICPSSNWLATSLDCQHIIRLAPSLSCWWRSSAVVIKGCENNLRKVKSILSQSIETPMSCDGVEFPTWKLNVELPFTSPPRRAV